MMLDSQSNPWQFMSIEPLQNQQINLLQAARDAEVV
jgi:hypothetical protein